MDLLKLICCHEVESEEEYHFSGGPAYFEPRREGAPGHSKERALKHKGISARTQDSGIYMNVALSGRGEVKDRFSKLFGIFQTPQ